MTSMRWEELGNFALVADVILSPANHVFGYAFQIVSQTEASHHVYEDFGGIESTTEFAGGIIPREGVVVVVKSFAERAK